MIRFRGVCQSAEGRAVESWDEIDFGKTEVFMYQHGLGAAHLAERVVGVPHQLYANLTESESVPQAPGHNSSF